MSEKFSKFVKDSFKYDFHQYNLLYLSNGLGGEVGELQNEIKKMYRNLHNGSDKMPDKIDEIKLELGDILWYIHAIVNQLNLNIEDIYKINMDKNTSNLLNR